MLSQPKRVVFVAFLGLALAALPAVSQMVDISTATARVFSAGPGQSLGHGGSVQAAVADFLASKGVPERSAASLVEVVANGSGDATHLRFEQVVDGRRVYGTYVKATLDANGSLVHVVENVVDVPARGLLRSSITEEDALRAALDANHPGFRGQLQRLGSNGDAVVFDKGSYFFANPMVTPIAVALVNGMEQGFLVETWSASDNLLYDTVVGRNGKVRYSQLRTAADSYNVFTESPATTPQTVVNGPGAGNAESPAGWVFSGPQGSQDISGNNVNAYVDADANDASDGSGTAVTDGNFLTGANLSQDPSTAQNKNVAVQNLFYFNNVIHDLLYDHGFNEAAGNFQVNNFGQGGLGGDPVFAEAQDGSGLDNANFATPSDGSSPRMQMYLWDQSNPRRDGDVDSDIVFHEYGHGLTWRMIGNMSGPLSGAIGEGASDVLSIVINDDDVVGEYSFNDPIGVRSVPYTNYPRTYGDFTGSEVHADGEIYAGAVWHLWKDVLQANGVSQDTFLDYMVDGMNFTPAGPAMEDMRDGMLAAASGSGDECLIWQGFADYGIGFGASATVKGGGPFGGGKVTVNESFALPPECGGSGGGGGGGSCTLGQPGDSCNADADCCSNNCKGRPGRQSCK